MNISVLSLIRAKYNTLSESQKIVANYVLNYADEVMLKTLNELASACGVSEATVLRFLHKIDYDSYQIFKINLTQEISKDTPNIVYEDIHFGDSAEEIKEKILISTTRSIEDSRQVISSKELDRLVNKIVNANKILIIGIGASASVANDLFHKLIKLGFNVVCSNDPHMINILSINLTKDDLIIAISHSGESREILDGVLIAKNQKCEVAAITSYAKSTLASSAKYVISSSSLETRFRSDAMTSRIIQIIIIDMIYVCIVSKLGDKILPQIHNSRIAVAKNKT